MSTLIYIKAILKRLSPLVLIVAISLFNSGCLFSYLVKSGVDQASLLSDREPIEKVLKRPDLKPEVRKKLELNLAARDFAKNDLKLKLTDSYKTYVELNRPYVTYVVLAAEKTKLKQHLFWYPLVGKLPYKGFFDKKDADDEAADFDKTKYDVIVRGVSAFSTLGWFDDPLLSSMINGDDHDLVNLIIHESTHATLYIKSQAEFNERLATFVGRIGTERYYKKTEGEKSPTLIKIQNEIADEKLYSQFISRELDQLKKWFDDQEKISPADQRDSAAFLALRELQYQNIHKRFETEVLPKLKTDNYKGFSKLKLNNAQLLYLKTYVYDLDEFQKLYDHFGQNLQMFLTFCKSLEGEKNPSQKIKSFLSARYL